MSRASGGWFLRCYACAAILLALSAAHSRGLRVLSDVPVECQAYDRRKVDNPIYRLREYDVNSRCAKGSTIPKHVIVVSRHSEEVKYLENVGLGNYVIYDVEYSNYNASERKDPYHGIPNRGKEAMAYLTYIAEYYDCLPEVVLFAHAHRQSTWHSVYDLDYNFLNARWDSIPGFAVLHRFGLWYKLYAGNTSLNLLGGEAIGGAECYRTIDGKPYRFQSFSHFVRGEWVRRAWAMLFGQSAEAKGHIPEAIHTSVSAEFFVTKARIQAHKRSFYLKAIQWIMDETDLFAATNGHRGMSSYETAVAFELLWHIIFGEPERFLQLTVPECDLYFCESRSG